MKEQLSSYYLDFQQTPPPTRVQAELSFDCWRVPLQSWFLRRDQIGQKQSLEHRLAIVCRMQMIPRIARRLWSEQEWWGIFLFWNTYKCGGVDFVWMFNSAFLGALKATVSRVTDQKWFWLQLWKGLEREIWYYDTFGPRTDCPPLSTLFNPPLSKDRGWDQRIKRGGLPSRDGGTGSQKRRNLCRKTTKNQFPVMAESLLRVNPPPPVVRFASA